MAQPPFSGIHGRGGARSLSTASAKLPTSKSAQKIYESALFEAAASGGVTGAATTAQAQTAIATGSATNPAVTGTVSTSQVQTTVASGSATVAAVTGTTASSQAQTVAAAGSYSAVGITGSSATSQAQTVAGTGSAAVASVGGVLTTRQAQTVAASGTASPSAVTGTGAARQAQTVALAGNTSPAAVSGTGAASQAQTTALSGLFAEAGGVIGVGSSSQGQTVNGSGSVEGGEIAPSFNGGFEMSNRKRVYIKRGKKYLIFNTMQEADAYVASEEAIETAKKSSRGAARRKAKALKVPSPEIVPAVELEALEALMARFDVSYDLPKLEATQDFATLHYIQERLAELQDDEDITLLLLAA